MIDWFQRLADIPGVGFDGSPNIDRKQLPGFNSRPEINTHSFDGKINRSLYWRSKEGGTSQSPAGQHASTLETAAEESWNAVMWRLYETLELPGEPSDYHFAILSCYEKLWKVRKQQPDVWQYLEYLWLLDVRLVEARPEIITVDRQDGAFFARVPAFDHLISLYAQEGFLEEALGIAIRAKRFEQEGDSIEELQSRILKLKSEDESES